MDDDSEAFLQALESLEKTEAQDIETNLTTLEQVFDFGTSKPTRGEVERIRKAALNRRIYLDLGSHAQMRSRQRGVGIEDLREVILSGQAVEKDFWREDGDRPTGISFVGSLNKGRFKVKVSWDQSYFYVTVHPFK